MPYQLSAFGFTPARPVDKSRFITVTDGDTFERMVRLARDQRVHIFDLETSGTEYYAKSETCGIALGCYDGPTLRNFYVPIRHRTGEYQLDPNLVLPAIREIMALPTLKIGHNIKFDFHFGRKDKIRFNGPIYDTMIASILYSENHKLGLKERATWLLDKEAGYWEDQVDLYTVKLAREARQKKKEYLNKNGYAQHPIGLLGPYATYDIEWTAGLWRLYEERFSISSRFPRVWQNEMVLVEALTEMEEHGMPINVPYLSSVQQQTSDACMRLDQEIDQLTYPHHFDVQKDDQLRAYLLRVLRVPLKELTENSDYENPTYSVNYDALAPFRKQWPVIGKIIERREAFKLESVYTNSIIKRLDPQHFVHCDLRQVGTTTGRLASADPNLQNIASDSDERALAHSGKKVEEGGIDPWSIKRAFIVEPGYTRLFADYSQVELRMIAKYSNDPLMVQAYINGEDLHAVAMKQINRPRRVAKVMNFGLAFCLTEQGLARQAEISLAEAEAAFRIYFEKFHGFKSFRDNFWTVCRLQQNQFQNMWGRPRRLWDLSNPDKQARKRAERQAIGTLIQGTAAELTKESLVRLYRWLKHYEGKLDAKLRLTIHDEIQLDVATGQADYAADCMRHYMEAYPEFAPIPIKVDIARSITTWADKGH